MQFRIRTLLLVLFVCSVIALLFSIYRDYIDIRLPSFSSQSPSQTDGSTSDAVKSIKKNHPPKTHEYWTEQLSNVKPKMTMGALFKYVPSAGNSYSVLRSDLNQAFYYPVDSKYGVACIMSTSNQRVVKPIGVFEHFLALDEFGGIEVNMVDGLKELLTE